VPPLPVDLHCVCQYFVLYVRESILIIFGASVTEKVTGHFGPKTLRYQDISARVPKCLLDTVDLQGAEALLNPLIPNPADHGR